MRVHHIALIGQARVDKGAAAGAHRTQGGGGDGEMPEVRLNLQAAQISRVYRWRHGKEGDTVVFTC